MKVKIDAGEYYPTLFLRAYDEDMDCEDEVVEMPVELFYMYQLTLGKLEIIESDIAQWCRDNLDMSDNCSLRRWAGVE